MTDFKDITIWIYNNNHILDTNIPKDISKYNYIKLRIIPTSNSKNISYIEGVYSYNDEQLTIKFNSLNRIVEQFSSNPGNNLSHVIEIWWNNLSTNERNTINKRIKEISINNFTYLDYFSILLGEILITYYLLLEDQNEIDNPFSPFNINLPILNGKNNTDSLISSIDKCHLRYLSIFSKIFSSINNNKIGKVLLLDINNFYHYFNKILPVGKSCDLVDALSDSLTGYLDYLNEYNNRFSQLNNNYKNIKQSLNEYNTNIDTQTKLSVNKVNERRTKAFTAINNAYQQVNANLNKTQEEYINRIDSKLKLALYEIQNKTDSVYNDILSKIDLEDDIRSKIIESLKTEISNIIDNEVKIKISENITDILDQSKTDSVNNIRDELKGYINQIGSMSKRISILEEKIDSSNSSNNTNIDTDIRVELKDLKYQIDKINKLLGINK